MSDDYPVAAFRLTHANQRLTRQITVRTSSWQEMQRWLERSRGRREGHIGRKNNMWIEEEGRPAVLIGEKNVKWRGRWGR